MPVLNGDVESDTGVMPQAAAGIEIAPTHPDENPILSGVRSLGEEGSVANFATGLSNIAGFLGADHTPDPNFDPIVERDKLGDKYANATRLNETRNASEFNVIKNQYDQDYTQKEEAYNAGRTGSLSAFLGNLADPINLIGIGEGKNIYNLRTAFLPSAFEGAKVGAAFGAGTSALSYTAHPTEQLSDIGDSITSTALLGTALGGSMGAFRDALAAGKIISGDKVFSTMADVADDIRAKSRQYADNISEKLNGYVPQESAVQAAVDAGKSAGAAESPKTSLEQETLRPGYIIPTALAEKIPERFGGSGAADLSQILGKTHMDATVELMNSPNIETRRTVQQLADVTADVQKNHEGISSEAPVVSYMKQREGEYTRATMDTYDAFMQYRKGRAAKVGDAVTGLSDYFRGTPEGKMSYPEFQDAIGQAMWQGDKHPVPEVQQAASQIWRPIFDNMKDEAVKHGLLPVDVDPKTATSYLTRVYNREKIIAQRPAMASILTGWLKENQDKALEKHDFNMGQSEIADKVLAEQYARRDDLHSKIAAAKSVNTPENKALLDNLHGEHREITDKHDKLVSEIESSGRNAKAAKDELRDNESIIEANESKSKAFKDRAKDALYLHGADDDELRVLSNEIIDGIIGLEPGRLSYQGLPVTRGPLKERTLLIPDERINEFLDRNIMRVGKKYMHTMGSDVGLTQKFGSTDMNRAFRKISDEYDNLRLQAAQKHGYDSFDFEGRSDVPEGLQNDLQSLDKSQRRDQELLSGIRDRLRGMYGMGGNPYSMSMRAYRVIKGINYLRSLGMMPISAMSHVAKIPAVHGIERVMGDGVGAMMRNMKQFKLSASEGKLANAGLEMASNYTQMALAGIDDHYDKLTGAERGLQYMTDNFRFVTLMGPEIAAMKQMAAVISQTRSLEAIESLVKGESITGDEQARLLKFGIDNSMAKRMWSEVNTHGVKQDDIWWANTAAWSDKEAAEAYRMALQREVDRIIVTPGQEVPLFMSKPLGSMLMQFRSFATASMQRTLLSGLQQRDSKVLGGALCATGLGMLSYWAKTPNEELSSDPKVWIGEGIDRGGMFGWLDDLNGAVESATANHVGLRPMLGAPPRGRWDNSKAATAVLGPTYGTVFNTLAPLAHDAASGNINQFDVHRVRQMLPYNNVFYMKKLFDAGESGINTAFNIQSKKAAIH